MNTSFFIARRYLVSKKSKNVINIISWISVLSVAIASFALITVLSAFNGLQDLVESMYDSFDPEIRVENTEGTHFIPDAKWLDAVEQVEGVTSVDVVIEELALISYNGQQIPCVLKGVNANFPAQSGLDQSMYDGNASLTFDGVPMAVIGYGLAADLSLYMGDIFGTLQVYTPKPGQSSSIDPSRAFYKKSIQPSGIFMINPDFDSKYLIVPIEFAREMIVEHEAVTAIEVRSNRRDLEGLKADIQSAIPSGLTAKTRYELNELIYKTNKAEKLITLLILTFILCIATFNVVGTLTMILLDKKKDIGTLKSLGFSLLAVRRIFLMEGLMINYIGGGIGLLIGILLCLAQQHFGLVRLEGGIVEFYPVAIRWQDILIILGIVSVIGYLASYLPSRLLVRSPYQDAMLKD